MAISNEFREAVSTGNKISVRIMLKDIMLVDPTMKQFKEMLDFAETNLQNLYDEHDGEVLKYDHSDWNVSYMNSQMVVVVNNFSKERVELLQNLVKFIYKDKIQQINTSYQPKSKTGITKKQVGMGITAVGAATAVAGICASQGMLIAGGVVAAVVGVGLIVTDKEA